MDNNNDNQSVISDQGGSSSDTSDEEVKTDSREKFTSKYGYNFLVPEGWSVSNADDWNKKATAEESTVVGVVKGPYKDTYPENFHANINVVVYRDGDDEMTSGENFKIEAIIGFMAHKDVCLEGDEELGGNSDDAENKYGDIVLNGLSGEEYFTLSPTNKGNWFIEDNIAIQVNKEKIYTFGFHDLGKRETVDENLKIFKEFIKSLNIENK